VDERRHPAVVTRHVRKDNGLFLTHPIKCYCPM
jgi:hypothetical protein